MKKINQLNEYRNEINLIYFANDNSKYNIFGYKFVKNNNNNIELIINGENYELVAKYILKKGKNIITLLIKNKLTNLSYMFYECYNLKDISKLKYLNVNEIKDFSYMFLKCSSLSDIKPLQNWNVSNCNNFSGMFMECSSLSDVTPLQNWNVSNGKEFYGMFAGCLSLSDTKPLQNWKYFEVMFDYDN